MPFLKNKQISALGASETEEKELGTFGAAYSGAKIASFGSASKLGTASPEPVGFILAFQHLFSERSLAMWTYPESLLAPLPLAQLAHLFMYFRHVYFAKISHQGSSHNIQ